MHREYELAIVEGDKTYIEGLLTNQLVPINELFQSGIRPLNFALLHNQIEVARVLLELGARVNDVDSFRYDERQKYPIHYAAQCGNVNIIQVNDNDKYIYTYSYEICRVVFDHILLLF